MCEGSFPPTIWNHHDTTTPRTNNHMEGFNRSLNFHVDSNKPTIYELILSMKTLELQIATQYLNRMYNKHGVKVNRKCADIDRDIRINQLKFRLNNQHIDFPKFMNSTAHIYEYEVDKKKNDQILPATSVNLPSMFVEATNPTEHPNIQAISGKKFDCIEKYFTEHRATIINMVKTIRNYNFIHSYTIQLIDSKCDFLYNYTKYLYPLETSSDGNCLFHATSISIYGDQSQSFNLKLCAAFIIYENQDFFKKVFEADGNIITIPYMVENVIKMDKWQNRNTIIALNIVTLRPIFSYGNTIGNSVITNVIQKDSFNITPNFYPICIAFNVNHFIGCLGLFDLTEIPTPANDTTCFWKFSFESINYY
jgi:hypothetical protein